MKEIQITSSKGNQNKYYKDGVWYKEDALGYEALAEVLVSRLLKKSNVQHNVCYSFTEIQGENRMIPGCESKDFMEPEDDKLVSVERLFQTYRGESAAKAILAYHDTTDRIHFVEKSVREITGMEDFGEYLREVLTLDAFFLNEDRHFHNLAVIRKKDGTYRKCPIFDNGAALFSDVRGDYPLSMNMEECLNKIMAKPFSVDFDEQLDACELAYPKKNVQFYFTMRDVEEILDEFQGIYDPAILKRIEELMRIQIRKYAYLFGAKPI